MRTLVFALMVSVPAVALAQIARISALPQLRADPPSSGLVARFGSGARGGGTSNGHSSLLRRYVLDGASHVYFGYDLLMEEQQPGTFLATFRELILSPAELSTGARPYVRGQPLDLTQWADRPLPAIPKPRVVHDGDTISLDLFIDSATGAKLIDDIRIQIRNIPNPFVVLPPPPLNRAVPTVSGVARDFTAADAEMQLTQPRVTLNGTPQSTTGRVPKVSGSLVWFYLPNHGRYVLSLVPRPDLDFKKAGEVRGGVIAFTLGEDSIKLECPNPVATGDAPYNLYVLHDPAWEPTAQAQKGQFALGSVDPGELAALKRQ